MQAHVKTPVVDAVESASPIETSFGHEHPVVTVPDSSLRPSPLNARTRLAALLHYLVPKALLEHFGRMSAPDFLALTGTNNQDSLLRAADDLGTSPAWSAVEAQRARWTAELPAKRADLLPWLVEQDPGTTLLDLLAFRTGTLLDGIAGEEKPPAINALEVR